MPVISTYADFLLATRTRKASAVNQLVNFSKKNNYALNTMMAGRQLSKMFKGGKSIVDHVMTGDTGNAGFINPGDPRTVSSIDFLKQIEVQWAVHSGAYKVTEEIIALNAGDDEALVDLRDANEFQCMTETFNSIEESLFALPNFDTMESTTASVRHSMSLLAYVTRDGQLPAAGNGGIAAGSSAWTSRATLDNTVTGYRSKFATYDATAITNLETGLIRALDSAKRDATFEEPSALAKWSDPGQTSLRKHVIMTNGDGVDTFNTVIRSLNDRTERFRDPGIAGPQYLGIPVIWVNELDNAGWTAGSPDYLGFNFNMIFPYFKTDWFLKSLPVPGGIEFPTTTAVFKQTLYNIVARDLRTQFRVSAA